MPNMKGRGAPPMDKKLKIDKKTVKRLLKYVVKDHKIKFTAVIICIVLSGLISMLGSIFIQRLVDVYIPGIQNGTKTMNDLITIVVAMIGVYAVAVFCSYLYNIIMSLMAQQILKDIRDEMYEKMQYLPVSYFDKNSYGDIMSVYTNDTDTLRQLVSICVPQTVSCLITIISVLVMMFSYSWILTLVVLLVTLSSMTIVKKITLKTGKYFVKQQEALGKTDAFIEEMINGQKVVKVFCHEEEAKKKFDEVNEELFSYAEEGNKASNILMPILGNIGYILYIILAIVGCLLFFYGGNFAVSVGVIVAFLTASRQFTQCVNQTSNQVGSIVLGLAGATRIFDIIDEQPEDYSGRVHLVNVTANDDGTNIVETKEKTGKWAWRHDHLDGTTTYKLLRGDVRFYGVNFGYTPEKEILHNITLYAKPCQKIAFVGATGAGKTTISNLINRFYEINEGKIRYDDINVNKIAKEDLRRSLGMVLQDVYLFSGTIMDNIRYGNLDATDEQVIEAAKLANADEFIRRLPQGYDTYIDGNGSGLSQGQRQLISIARCAISDPPVMILDEATSSIDTRTEELVQKGMDELMKGRTVFVIAHRLSTIKNADAIVVLDHGNIIEKGDHKTLIDNHGMYYMLYTGAFELK